MAKHEPALPPGSPEEPQVFGKYYLMGLIARGGMAEVYRARPRNAADRLVAIKCMRPNLAKESKFVEMFVREGKLAVMLHHDNIVRTVEIGRVQGHYFIAMEYISGKDLTQVLRTCQEQNKRIPVPHAVFIAAKVCEGLHHAHNLSDPTGRALNIVNRDVSPSNIRVSYDGEVKLLDFGIAQAMLKFTSEIGVLKGKFSYMSPEQIRGMPLDCRTDVFSTGIVLHEMLTTEKLFRGTSEFDLMEKVRNADVSPPSKFNRRVPKELDDIVLKALAREPADRYQTAAEFAEDLNELLTRYQFDPTELQSFLRGLFREDFREERHLVEACLAVAVEGREPVHIDDSSNTQGAMESDRLNEVGAPHHDVGQKLVSGGQKPLAEVEETAGTQPTASTKSAVGWLIPVLLVAALGIVATAIFILLWQR